MDDTPSNFYPSEYPFDEWYTVTEFARELDTSTSLVLTALKTGLLPGWRKPSGRKWRIPPEVVDETLWAWTERRIKASPRSTARYCAEVFDLTPADRVRLEEVLTARRPADPMSTVARWLMRGISSDRRSVTPSAKRRIRERDGNRCTYCRRKAKRYEYDHVTPVSWGGDRHDGNVVLACRECNRMKRDSPAFPCLTCQRLTWSVGASGRNRCGCESRPYGS